MKDIEKIKQHFTDIHIQIGADFARFHCVCAVYGRARTAGCGTSGLHLHNADGNVYWYGSERRGGMILFRN